MKIEVLTGTRVFDTSKPRVVVHTGLYSKAAYHLLDKMLKVENSLEVDGERNDGFIKLHLLSHNIYIGSWMSQYKKYRSSTVSTVSDEDARYKYAGVAQDGEVVLWIPEYSDVFQESRGPVMAWKNDDDAVDKERLKNEVLFILKWWMRHFAQKCGLINTYVRLYEQLEKDEPDDAELIGAPFNPLQEQLYLAVKKRAEEEDVKSWSTFGADRIEEADWQAVVKWIDGRIEAYKKIEGIYDI